MEHKMKKQFQPGKIMEDKIKKQFRPEDNEAVHMIENNGVINILQELCAPDKKLAERFEFRSIRQEEADQAVAIEQICFPPNEACSERHMKERIAKAPELFLMAIDRKTGKAAGLLNGLSTDECAFRDEFFTNAELYAPEGKNIMLLGLDVLPDYRRQGLGRELMYEYLRREQRNGRKTVILTCLKSKVEMYEKMGFQDEGISASSWGGEEWHEMSRGIGI